MTIKRLRRTVASKSYHNKQRKRFLKALEIIQLPSGVDELEFQNYLRFVRRCLSQIKWHIKKKKKKAAK